MNPMGKGVKLRNVLLGSSRDPQKGGFPSIPNFTPPHSLGRSPLTGRHFGLCIFRCVGAAPRQRVAPISMLVHFILFKGEFGGRKRDHTRVQPKGGLFFFESWAILTFHRIMGRPALCLRQRPQSDVQLL